MKSIITLLLFFNLIISLFAQKNVSLKASDFIKGGQAEWFGGDCYQLTTATNWTSGSIWYKRPINLEKPFEMEIDGVFGCKDYEGADGIVFVLTTRLPATGFQGEGMGFGGLKPSLGIELDTYQNYNLNDPPYDHIALIANGNPNHYMHPYKTYQANASSKNIEDCKRHRLKVTWNPKKEQLQVFFDGILRITHQQNIVQTLFENNSEVHWGFTSATGGKNNRHQICFEKTVFEAIPLAHEFDEETREQLLNGEIINLEKIEFQTGKDLLSATSLSELDKLYHLLKENPKLSLQIFGHTDNRGGADNNLWLSQKRAEAIGAYLMKKGIEKSRLTARGNGEKFPIADNATAAGRAINRRIEVMLWQAIP